MQQLRVAILKGLDWKKKWWNPFGIAKTSWGGML